MTISSTDLAAAVLAVALGGRVAGRVNAEYLQTHYFPTASRSAVLRAISAASRDYLIVDLSHHGARPDWAPSRDYMLQTIAELRARVNA